MAAQSVKCKKCGAQLEASAQACPQCGKEQKLIQCARCGKLISARIKKCPECGANNKSTEARKFLKNLRKTLRSLFHR